MAMDSLVSAFYEELRDVFSAEKQLLEALPEIAENASSSQLKAAIESHCKETEQQVKRVEAAFEETGKTAQAKNCEAMKGLIEEARLVVEQKAGDKTRDAMILACALKVEHYEIATYGTLCRWAQLLGYSQAEKMLKQNLQEEEAADSKLSAIAETVNTQALQQS